MITEIFYFLKFQECINKLGKICFPLGKMKFEPIGNFAHTIGFLTLRKVLLILLPLYLQMLIMQISTQTDNHKHRESVATKKVVFIKINVKFQNPKFNTLYKLTFIFL